MEITNKALKQAFIKSQKIRVPFILEDTYWDYQMSLFDRDFNCQSEWEEFQDGIDFEFSGDTEAYCLSFGEAFRNGQDFLKGIDVAECLTEEEKNATNTLKQRMSFKKELSGHTYLSIDIIKATSYFMNNVSVIDNWDAKYDELCSGFTMLKESKKLRVDMYKQTSFDEHLECYCASKLLSVLDSDNELILKLKELGNPCFFLKDELRWDITDKVDEYLPYINDTTEIAGVPLHIRIIRYDTFKYVTRNNRFTENVKTYLPGGNKVYSNFGSPFYSQFSRIAHDEEITPMDLAYPDGTVTRHFDKAIRVIK